MEQAVPLQEWCLVALVPEKSITSFVSLVLLRAATPNVLPKLQAIVSALLCQHPVEQVQVSVCFVDVWIRIEVTSKVNAVYLEFLCSGNFLGGDWINNRKRMKAMKNFGPLSLFCLL